MRFVFVFCVLSAFNTLLFPTFQRSFQIAGQAGAYALDCSLLEIIAGTFSPASDATDEEVDDLSEDVEFLSCGSAFLYPSFDLDNSKNKIQTQQHALLNPFLEKSTPPPRLHRS
jgi:hypothetical protein